MKKYIVFTLLVFSMVTTSGCTAYENNSNEAIEQEGSLVVEEVNYNFLTSKKTKIEKINRKYDGMYNVYTVSYSDGINQDYYTLGELKLNPLDDHTFVFSYDDGYTKKVFTVDTDENLMDIELYNRNYYGDWISDSLYLLMEANYDIVAIMRSFIRHCDRNYNDFTYEVLYEKYTYDDDKWNFEGEEKQVVTYLKTENLASSYIYNRASENDVWTLSNMNQEAYDKKGNLILQAAVYEGVGIKYLYEYNDYFRVVGEVEYAWSNENNTWVLDKKYDYVLNDADFRILELVYSWDNELSTWVNYERVDREFTSKNHILLVLYSSWNNDNAKWDSYKKQEFGYNDEEECIAANTYYWLKDVGWVDYYYYY